MKVHIQTTYSEHDAEYQEFMRYCLDNNINISKLLRQLIHKFLREANNEKKI